MSDEPIQQIPAGMIRLSGEMPALRMATVYRESGHTPLTKSALAPSEQALRGAGFGAYAVEPELFRYKFKNQIPLAEDPDQDES